MVTTRVVRHRPPGARDFLAVRGQVNVLDPQFGVVGDGATDDRAALTSAVATASALLALGKRATLVFPECAGYAVSSPGLSIPKGIDVLMDADIIALGSGNYAALTIGTTGVGGYTLHGRYRLRQRRAVQSDWTSEANVGIKLVNLYGAHIDIMHAEGNTIGVNTVGDGSGFAYNHIRPLRILNNKIALDTDAINSGWNNENTLYGGNLAVASGVLTTLERIGWRITSTDATYLNNNNNVWHHPSFELLMTGAGQAVCVDAVYGQDNRVLDARAENIDLLLRTAHAVLRTTVQVGYYGSWGQASNLGNGGYDDVQNGSTSPTNYAYGAQFAYAQRPMSLLWALPDAAGASSYYSATQAMVLGAGLVNTNTLGLLRASVNMQPRPDHLLIEGSVGVGTMVDTSVIKHLVARVGLLAGGTAGRWLVRCYDAAGAILSDTTGQNNGAYVKSTPAMTYSASTAYNGYWCASNTSEPLSVELTAAVKSVWIGYTYGSAGVWLQSLWVGTPDPYGARVWPGYPEAVPLGKLSTISPTKGVWGLGEVVTKPSPTASTSNGWTVSTGGGASSATWAATTAYALHAFIKTSTGVVLEATVAGTSASSEPAPSAVGDVIVDGTVAWVCRSLTSAVFKTLPAIGA